MQNKLIEENESLKAQVNQCNNTSIFDFNSETNYPNGHVNLMNILH